MIHALRQRSHMKWNYDTRILQAKKCFHWSKYLSSAFQTINSGFKYFFAVPYYICTRY
jgi:hypothetical protein